MQNRRHIIKSTAATMGALAFPAIIHAQQNQTITWATHPAILAATGDGELIRKFESLTGIKVDVVTFPTDALAQRIQTEFVARSQAFDVVNVADAFWTPTLARFVAPLDNYAKLQPLPNGGLADFSKGMLDFFRVPQAGTGALYAIPFRMGVSLLFYRKDLLQSAGMKVPSTFEEYGQSVKQLTRDGMRGTIIQGVLGQQGVLDWYEYASPQGVDLIAANLRKAAFNTPAALDVLEKRRQWIVDGIVEGGAASYSFDDSINAVAQGRAAMTVMSSAYWARVEDAKTSKVAGKIGYAAPMRSKNVNAAHPVRGWGLAINQASQKKLLAWEFIKFISDAPQQKWMGINKGNAVTRLSVLRDAEYGAKVPVAQALADTLSNAKLMPSVTNLTAIYDTVGRQLNAALSGATKPAEALKLAEAEVNKLLAKS